MCREKEKERERENTSFLVFGRSCRRPLVYVSKIKTKFREQIRNVVSIINAAAAERS